MEFELNLNELNYNSIPNPLFGKYDVIDMELNLKKLYNVCA